MKSAFDPGCLKTLTSNLRVATPGYGAQEIEHGAHGSKKRATGVVRPCVDAVRLGQCFTKPRIQSDHRTIAINPQSPLRRAPSYFVGERCRLVIGFVRVGEAGGDRACFDSLGDLNFMEEPLIVVWTIRRIGCWIFGG